MTRPPAIEHCLIVRHPSEPALLLDVSGPRPRLPAFTSQERHTADVEHITRAVRERWGLSTTVLRGLGHAGPPGARVVRVHELHTHGAGPLPADVRWCGTAAARALIESGDADVVAAWLAQSPARVIDGREWTRPGWLDDARAWIDASLAGAGAGVIDEVVQVRSWMSSCVLRVHATAGIHFFKAVALSLRREVPVTAYLAHRCPGAVPAVVAVEAERRWLLTRMAPGRVLETIGDLTAWTGAVETYGRLQRACGEAVAELHGLGCPTRALDELPPAVERLCADASTTRPGGPESLSSGEVDRLAAARAEIARRCQWLAADGLPPTLEHGDFWPSNVLVDGTACAIIDWEDVAVAHPFLGLAPLLVGLEQCQPDLASPAALARLEDAYLAALVGGTPPETMRVALRLARPLGLVDLAVRYAEQRASAGRLHPWMRDLVPQTLRLALSQLDATM